LIFSVFILLNFILGGTWCFYNERNRSLAKEIFRKIIDTKIAGKYHKMAPIQKEAQISSFSVTMCIRLLSPSRLFTIATAAYNMETASHFQLKELVAAL